MGETERQKEWREGGRERETKIMAMMAKLN